MNKKWMALVTAAILLLGIFSGCNKQDSANGDKKLVMATSADYAPFEYMDTKKGDEIIGFDIDLAKKITENLGYELEIKNMDFKGVIPAVTQKQADFALSGINPNPERAKSVDFSVPYYKSKHSVVFLENTNLQSQEDLKGKVVGVQLGSTQEAIADNLKDVKIEKRNKIPELVQEIKSSRMDAALIEESVAKGYLESDQNLKSFLLPDSEDVNYVIAFQKDSELKEQFDKEIKKLQENGELQKLQDKWFSKQQ
ncbi:transporter substrate-binding domain-containing protein [Massilibacterium senegalense]|uniref:transporter substrate-binding domain-containing protein n=1 Tax=Massilibacterium senegalense TaxID=1632858 RepID=UPI00093A9965|nr:transporter substrate-binding domain-containing protein [Massilibacterium senegalense]